MIERINSILPSSQNEIGLNSGELHDKTHSKKNIGHTDSSPKENEVEESPIPPPNIRYLGKNLDLIA